MDEIKSRPPGRVVCERTTSTDDSDVSVTTPTGKVRHYRFVAAQLNCTATVGNRVFTVAVLNSSGGQMYCWVSANIAASQVGQIVLAPNMPYSTTPRSGVLTSPNTNANVVVYDSLPDLYLTAGMCIRIYDKAAIDAAADDVYYDLCYEEWDV